MVSLKHQFKWFVWTYLLLEDRKMSSHAWSVCFNIFHVKEFICLLFIEVHLSNRRGSHTINHAGSSWFSHYPLRSNSVIHEIKRIWLINAFHTCIFILNITNHFQVHLTICNNWIICLPPVKNKITFMTSLSYERRWHISHYQFIVIEERSQNWLTNLW